MTVERGPSMLGRRCRLRRVGAQSITVLALMGVVGCEQHDASPRQALSAVAQTAPSDLPPPAVATPAALAVADHGEIADSVRSAEASCLAADTVTAAPRAALAIHRWTDSRGIVHYSDQGAPSDATDERIIAVNAPPPISVTATGYDSDLPDRVEQRAAIDALGVQRAMHDALGVPAPDLALQVVFVKSAANYASLIDDPALASSAGAYSTGRRTIYIRMQSSDEADFTILRHELTHALIHDSVGMLPTSMNEGLAEFFARMQVAGLGARVDVAADRAALLAAKPVNGADALVDLLARDGSDFYSVAGESAAEPRQRETRYTRAYALVATLMRDGEGRKALSAVLAAQRAHPCDPVTAEALLDQNYPGGLRALGGAWIDFMRNPPVEIDI